MIHQKRQKKNEAVPKGADYLPNTSMKQIVQMHRREKDGFPKIRLSAAKKRKEGAGIRSIARDLGIPYSTCRNWLYRMHHEGLGRRFNKKSLGRVRRLKDKVLASIKEWIDNKPDKYGFEAGSWQLNMLQTMLKSQFNMVCNKRTLRRTLNRLGFSYRKSRPVPHNSADQTKCKQFTSDTHTLITELRAEGYVVLVQDECHVQVYQKPSYGWRARGGHEEAKSSFSKKTASVFGVLGQDGYRIRTVDACNSKTFKKFLQDMLRIYPKIVMILDNAPYHKSKIIKEFVESHDNLKLIWLPPYTPQLNPIEMQWGVLKRILAGRYFETVEDLRKSIASIARYRQMKPVKLMLYLR